jgi:hypothetical protein
MVMSAFLGLLAMTIVFSSFYVMRTWSYWLTVCLASCVFVIVCVFICVCLSAQNVFV